MWERSGRQQVGRCRPEETKSEIQDAELEKCSPPGVGSLSGKEESGPQAQSGRRSGVFGVTHYDVDVNMIKKNGFEVLL